MQTDPLNAPKRSLLSRIFCLLAAMGAFFVMLGFAPLTPGPEIHEAGALVKILSMLLAASVFAIPILVYLLGYWLTGPGRNSQPEMPAEDSDPE